MSNRGSFVLLLFLFLSIFICKLSYSQIIPVEHTLNWELKKGIADQSNIYLTFTNSSYCEKSEIIPVFTQKVALDNFDSKTKATMVNPVWVKLSDKEISAISSCKHLIPNITEIESNTFNEGGKPFAILSFIPLRRNPDDNSIEKLIRFEIIIESYATNSSLKNGIKTFSNNSILKSGSFYKFGITQTGIYKIGYNDLVSLGISPANINPQNIAVFGYGNGMLPLNNNASIPDDLPENAIFVSGEADGKFDQGDYILFYAQGPVNWVYNNQSKQFQHQGHAYSDQSYYFITTDAGIGTKKRVQIASLTTQTPTDSVSHFNDYAVHERDLSNLIKSGICWFGEKFDQITSTYSFGFNFPNIIADSVQTAKYQVLARSTSLSSFDVTLPNKSQNFLVNNISGSYTDYYAQYSTATIPFQTSNGAFSTSLKYNLPYSSALGWLDFIEMNVFRKLTMTGGQMSFRTTSTIKSGSVTLFKIDNASSSLQVWNVNDAQNPVLIQGDLSGNLFKFPYPTSELQEFTAFNGNSYYSISPIGKIENQNLHALQFIDYIIVAHPKFIEQANRLAQLHRERSGLTVEVVTTNQVYNEFSSGAQDPIAIRRLMKILYDKAIAVNSPLKPRYLCLFGDGSYDNKNRLANNTNYIVTYQSQQSLNVGYSYASDDIFGFLDNNESSTGLLDIGIGRIPVTTLTEAKEMVDKIDRYTSPKNLVTNSFSNEISNFADWRNTVTFVSDDADNGDSFFFDDSEKFSTYLKNYKRNFNVDKIYMDAYAQQSTPGGQRYPDVNEAIDKRVNKGSLLLNYQGHGGELGWAHERVLDIGSIQKWNNRNNMVIMMTATCEFTRYDDPGFVSAGENCYINPTGGAVALLTTSRLAWSGTNSNLNTKFIYNFFTKENGRSLTLGEVFARSKNDLGAIEDPTVKNFILIGDPALPIAFPKYNVNTTYINGIPAYGLLDTAQSLTKVTIQGEITDSLSNRITGFNGFVFPTVFDKVSQEKTLNNDGMGVRNFELQKNILYKGKAEVKNGTFSFSFIVPKDIAYNYGFGKISYYACSDSTDASGVYDLLTIGGSNPSVSQDTKAPSIKLYMNDTNFVSGGITNESPILLAYVYDSSGINTVGNGIGHDIMGTLDNNYDEAFPLNDYYQAFANSYQQGIANYQMSNLESGTHTIKVKVWDVYNNSAFATITFIVKPKDETVIDNVNNYPNPFSDYTYFAFEHNQPDKISETNIYVYTIFGSLVKTIYIPGSQTGFRSEPYLWDGKSDSGSKLSAGLYIYKIQCKLTDGSSNEKSGKLIISQ